MGSTKSRGRRIGLSSRAAVGLSSPAGNGSLTWSVRNPKDFVFSSAKIFCQSVSQKKNVREGGLEWDCMRCDVARCH